MLVIEYAIALLPNWTGIKDRNWLLNHTNFLFILVLVKQIKRSMSNSKELKVTSRSKIRRLPKRGSTERELIYSILDEALIAHVGFVTDNQPFVIPMTYGREGDRIE